MKKIVFSLACISFLFGNNYDLGLESYKNKEYKKAYEYFIQSANDGNSSST